jgi:hypothetical protein
MKPSRREKGDGKAEGVSDLAREGDSLITPLQGLIGVTKKPER